MTELAMMSDEQLKRLSEVFKPFIQGLGEWIQRVSEAMQKLFPIAVKMNEAHRAEVKRVHTAYRRKKGKRW